MSDPGPTTARQGTVTWADLEAADPDLAATALALLRQRGAGEALLATVRGDLPPRIHPVNVDVVDGSLVTVVLGDSAKARDLEADGRYALHAHVDLQVPRELLVRGRAHRADEDLRARAAALWAFTIPDDALVVELSVDHVLLGDRADADAWPPVYTSRRLTPRT